MYAAKVKVMRRNAIATVIAINHLNGGNNRSIAD
jgi:hypothetical protein